MGLTYAVLSPQRVRRRFLLTWACEASWVGGSCALGNPWGVRASQFLAVLPITLGRIWPMMEELGYECHRGLCNAFFRRFVHFYAVSARFCCGGRLPRR